MVVYVGLNWLVCIATALLLGLSLWRDRSLAIRPSIFVLLFFHLLIQWAAAVDARRIYGFLPNPWPFLLLAQGFPLAGVVVSLRVGRREQWALWQRIVRPAATYPRYRRRVSLVLAAGIAVVLAYYLARVPIRQTGLYAILFEPARSAAARENSLKLLGDPVLRYAFGFMASALAPMLAVLLAEQVAENARPLRLRRVLSGAIGIAVILIVVSASGARAFSASIVLVVVLSRFLRRGFPLRLAHILLATLAVLAVPTVLTVLREGRQLDWSSFWSMLLEGGILRRVFYVPMETGTWYVHYAQTNGFIGVRGIPKLAQLWGLEPLWVPNVVGLLYAANPLQTINANTCYVFSYYSYFGLLSLPFSLLGLWLLDGALWIYRGINDDLLLPCVVTVCYASVAFVSTDYTVVFLSHGWAVTLIVVLALDRMPWLRRMRQLKAGDAPHPDAKSINLHVYPNALIYASRIRKETRTAADADLADEIHIAAIWEKDLPEHERLDEKRQVWRVRLSIPERRPTRLWKAMRYAEWQLRIFARFHTQPVRLVNCHHLAALFLGCLLKTSCKSALVYDTHELETEAVGRHGFVRLLARVSERALIRRADAVIAVNESIAAWYRHKYGLDNVYVVRNVPHQQAIQQGPSRLKNELGLREDEMLFIYQGGLEVGRGVELLLDVFAGAEPGRHIVFMGCGTLEALVREYERSHRAIHFHPAVSPQSVHQYTSGADLGVFVCENVCLSYFLCLPNKVFEYIMAGLPIVVSDFPEMSRLVDESGCGWKVSPDKESVRSLIAAISWEEIRSKKARALQYRQTLGWHKEEATLRQAYRDACRRGMRADAPFAGDRAGRHAEGQ